MLGTVFRSDLECSSSFCLKAFQAKRIPGRAISTPALPSLIWSDEKQVSVVAVLSPFGTPVLQHATGLLAGYGLFSQQQSSLGKLTKQRSAVEGMWTSLLLFPWRGTPEPGHPSLICHGCTVPFKDRA